MTVVPDGKVVADWALASSRGCQEAGAQTSCVRGGAGMESSEVANQAVQLGYIRDEELDFEAVVFAFEDGESLELQANLVADEPYSVGSNHRGAAYDSVMSWSANDDTLILRFTDEAVAELEYPKVLDVEAPAGELPSMLPHIERILGMPPTEA
jgi:hypothetical protein